MRRTKAAAIVMALGLAGCGGVDFAGKYKGPLHIKQTCPAGVSEADTEVTYDIKTTNDGFTFSTPKCGDLSAVVNDNSATVQQKTCPPYTNETGQITVTITGGTFALNGTALTVNLSQSIAIAANGETATCTASATGTLAKQSE